MGSLKYMDTQYYNNIQFSSILWYNIDKWAERARRKCRVWYFIQSEEEKYEVVMK